jgi:hypothetical protein
MLQVKFNGILIPDNFILENYADSIRLIIPRETQSGPVTVDINVKDELVNAQSGYFNYLPLSNVITYAGTGVAGTVNGADPLQAEFRYPMLITYDPILRSLYIGEKNSTNTQSIIRQISSTDSVSTLLTTSNYNIQVITSDNGGQKYVAASSVFSSNTVCLIYKLSNSGSLTLLSSSTCGFVDNTTIASARFNDIKSISFDSNNNLYVTDGSRIRKIDIVANLVTTIAGTGVAGFRDGLADSAKFSSPNSVIVENDGTIYISDKGNNLIRKLKSGEVSTVAGIQGAANFTNTASALSSNLDNPRTVVSDYIGNIYILEKHCMRQINPATNSIKIFAGNYQYPDTIDGPPLIARFNNPNNMVYDKVKKIMYIADSGNNKIRKISFE